MREYVFIDEKQLSLLSQQVPASSQQRHLRKKNLGFSIAGPKVELLEERDNSPLSSHEKIDNLIKELAHRDLLAYRRPIKHPDPDERRPFVLEETLACRLILPSSAVAQVPGIQNLAVWISDPAPDELSLEDGYDWKGSFLYLTEMWLDDKTGGHFWSGCSALQMIANAVSGKNLLAGVSDEFEPLGRGSYLHPVRKLVNIGAKMTSSMMQKVEVLYKKRYFTDEQCFELRGVNYRANDLLGYPVFIARKF